MDSAEIQALLDGPAGSPPAGEESNLTNPPNLRRVGHGVLLTFVSLATVALIIRLYTKLFIMRKVRFSDYSIILGWGVFVGYAAPCWLLTKVAPGVDQWNLTLRNFESMLYYGHIGSIMYGICIFFIKLSILLQYLEVFVPVKMSNTSYIYWSCHVFIWVLFVFYFLSTFLEIFSCRPLAKAWNQLLDGTCMNTLVLNVAASSINSATDLMILVLPQVAIWRLRMSISKKISVSALFLIAILACISSVVRLAYAVKLEQTANNIAYFFYLAGLWTVPEMGLGIVVCCLPVLPKFAQRLATNGIIMKLGDSLQSLVGRSSSRSQKSNNSYTMNTFTEDGLNHQRLGSKGYAKYNEDDFPLVISTATADMHVHTHTEETSDG